MSLYLCVCEGGGVEEEREGKWRGRRNKERGGGQRERQTRPVSAWNLEL